MAGSVLYLHGFLSSPQSAKAQMTRSYLQQHFPDVHFYAPQLSGVPVLAWQQAQQAFSQMQEDVVGIIGSSMGGFLASLIAQRHQVKASIINPAVSPHTLFPNYIGAHVNPYTQEAFELTHAHIDMVTQLIIEQISNPDLFQVFLQTDDEVLDYHLAEKLYSDCNLHITQGGDHAYQDYALELPKITRFLGLAH